MEYKPPLDRELLIPILISGLSIIGIVAVLLIGRSMNAPAAVAATPSTTPFQYVYLGTEPAISTALVDVSEIAPDGISPDPLATDAFPPGALPTNPAPVQRTPSGGSASTPLVLPTLNVTSTTGVIILQTNTPNRPSAATATPRNVTGTAAAANTYDDTDSRLVYSGPWLNETDVDGAHQSTLHVSTSAGSSVTFTFTGQAIELFYQPGPSLGTMTVTVDSLGSTPVSQTQGGTWSSGTLSNATHTVVIEHNGGGSINIDWLRVTPSLTTTPTATATATATPTQ